MNIEALYKTPTQVADEDELGLHAVLYGRRQLAVASACPRVVTSSGVSPMDADDFGQLARQVNWITANSLVPASLVPQAQPISIVGRSYFGGHEPADRDQSTSNFAVRLRLPSKETWVLAVEDISNRSEWIAELKDDWNGDGAPAIGEAVWHRARQALAQLINRARVAQRTFMPPAISPTAEGGVDLFWKTSLGNLLLTVPKDSSESAFFSIVRGLKILASGKLNDEGRDHIVSFLFSAAPASKVIALL